jgi:hypothetical protein
MVDTLARVDVKRALPGGRRKLVMTGVELLEKLVPLMLSDNYISPATTTTSPHP